MAPRNETSRKSRQTLHCSCPGQETPNQPSHAHTSSPALGRGAGTEQGRSWSLGTLRDTRAWICMEKVGGFYAE